MLWHDGRWGEVETGLASSLKQWGVRLCGRAVDGSSYFRAHSSTAHRRCVQGSQSHSPCAVWQLQSMQRCGRHAAVASGFGAGVGGGAAEAEAESKGG